MVLIIKAICYVAVLTTLMATICGKSTEQITMPSSSCDDDGAAMLVDAVQITSKSDDVRRSCTVKLKADLSHFMISIKNMKLSCGQYVKLYHGTNSSEKPDKVFDCRTQRYEIKDFLFIPHKTLTIRFEKPLIAKAYNFSLIVTSYESEFFCESDQVDCMYKEQEICVDDDLQCDGIVNCPDGKDERFCTYSVDDESMSSVAVGIVVTVIVLSILACAGCIFGLVRWCWLQRRHCYQGTVVTQRVMTQQSVQSAATPLVYYPPATQQQTPGPVSVPDNYQTMTPTQQIPVSPFGAYPQSPATPADGYQQVVVVPPSGGYPVTPMAPAQEVSLCPPAPYNPQFDPQMNCMTPPPYSSLAGAPPYSTQAVADTPQQSAESAKAAPPQSTQTEPVANAPPDSTHPVANAPPDSSLPVASAPPDSAHPLASMPPDVTQPVATAPQDSTQPVPNAPPDSTQPPVTPPPSE